MLHNVEVETLKTEVGRRTCHSQGIYIALSAHPPSAPSRHQLAFTPSSSSRIPACYPLSASSLSPHRSGFFSSSRGYSFVYCTSPATLSLCRPLSCLHGGAPLQPVDTSTRPIGHSDNSLDTIQTLYFVPQARRPYPARHSAPTDFHSTVGGTRRVLFLSLSTPRLGISTLSPYPSSISPYVHLLFVPASLIIYDSTCTSTIANLISLFPQ